MEHGIIIYRDGKKHWKFSDGTILPYVAGGSDAGGGTGVPGVQDPPAPAPADTIVVPPPGAPAPAPGAPPPGFWTEEQVNAERERIRKEEKDKLYQQNATKTQLEQQLSEYKAREAEREKAIADAQKAAEEEARKKAEADMDAKQLIESRTAQYEREQAELRQELAKMEEQRQIDLAMLEKERKYTEMITYRAQRMQQEQENIHPVLTDTVTGNTPEEIDASIEVAKQKTQALTGEVNDLLGRARQATPTAPPTGAPPVGPLEQAGERKEFSLREFQDLPLSEYGKYRGQLGVTRGGPSNEGMFR